MIALTIFEHKHVGKHASCDGGCTTNFIESHRESIATTDGHEILIAWVDSAAEQSHHAAGREGVGDRANGGAICRVSGDSEGVTNDLLKALE
eukprot:5385309-Amphidinium_carterae.1